MQSLEIKLVYIRQQHGICVCSVNISFWLFFAHWQNFCICSGIFYIFLSFCLISMQALHSMMAIKFASHILCTCPASHVDDWFHTQKSLKCKEFHFLISLFVRTLHEKSLVQLFFTIMRPILQTNLRKHVASNKHTSSLIFCSVTSGLNYKCLFHIHLSMIWLVFSIQRLAYVLPGSTDKNYNFPPFVS